jgi:glycosyltransferase involved in cell wall biosynthesis
MLRVAFIDIFYGVGGGVRTASFMAQTLLHHGHYVALFGLDGLPIDELDRIHGTSLSKYLGKTLTIKYYINKKWILSRLFRFRYFTLRYYNLLVQHVIRFYKPDILVLFDDIPPFDWPVVDSQVVIYTHFPYAARIAFDIYDMLDSEYINYADVLKERVFRKTFLYQYFYISNVNNYNNIHVLANSTVTAIYSKYVWGVFPVVLYPPAAFPPAVNTDRRKKNIIVSLGVISPGKRHGEVIEAFKEVKKEVRDAKLFIIGSLVDVDYYHNLLRKIRNYHLENDVFIWPNISDEKKWLLLSRAKVLVHAKRFEPFGIAVVEAMTTGTVPVVYRGCTSGPWIDITGKGRFGLGFKSQEEMVENIIQILKMEQNVFNEISEKIIKRTYNFSYNVFENNFIQIVRSLI